MWEEDATRAGKRLPAGEEASFGETLEELGRSQIAGH